VSRRARGSRRVPNRAYGNVEPPQRAGARSSADAPGPSIREQLEGATPQALALLPIRFFFGATFLYAGIDKILDPTFFDASAPSSIVAQLAAFARVSPLSPLIRVTEPFAIPIGILIALAEIAIGLGALTGLVFRVAAFGGMALSFTFWLTASWATKPYYFGPDLPYAIGWMALLIAGDGGLLVPRAVRDLGATLGGELPWSLRASGGADGRFLPPAYMQDEPSESRRLLIQASVLGAISLVVASMAVPVRVLRGVDDVAASTGGGDAANAGATPANAGASAAPSASPVPGGPTSAPAASAQAPTLTGLTVASTAQVDRSGAVRIRVPANAPSTLPAGDPALVVKLQNGGYACFDAICTHQGCRVGWDAQDGVMLCPCHGAAFDPNNHAAVLQGPTNQPLLELPIIVDHAKGTITLKA
jgi:thiosulfate dehydrogenase (quinone) large subunit